MRSIFRIIKFAFQDLGRNFGMSIMIVFILVLMLMSVNTLLVVRVVTQEATTAVKEQIDVSIYFEHDASEEIVDEIQEYVALFPEVVDVRYLSSQDVLDQFSEQHRSNPDILDSLHELDENPFGPQIILRTENPGDFEVIVEALSVPEYSAVLETRMFEDTQQGLSTIERIMTQIERFSLGLTILFALIAFLIIFNAIRVAIYTQREEISIKKLVGATNMFVRGPYLLQTAILSFFSVIIAYSLILVLAQVLDPYIAVVLGQHQVLTAYFGSSILLLLSAEFGAVLLLTIISSTLAMRKYLRV